MRAQGRQQGLGCLTAVATTAAVVLLRRFVLADTLATDALLYLLLLAVTAAAWLGGLKAGLPAMLLSAAAGIYCVIAGNGWRIGTEDRARFALFVVSGLAISWLVERMHRSRERADEQREELRLTLTSIGDAVITTDAEGRITSLNQVAADVTGWPPDEAAGRPLEEVFRIINEQTRHPVENPVKKVLAEGRIVGLANHTLLIAKDGTERPIDDSAAPIRDVEGAVVGVVLIFRDIAERRRAERTRARLAAIVESSDDAIYSKDLDGIVQSWNQGAERLFGYTAEEVVGKPVSLLISPDHPDELPNILQRLKRGERIEHYETARVRKDNRPLDISLSVSPIKDERGNVIGASSIARDNTERKQLLQQLREADRRKDEFLATLAHELRNPLAPIRYALQILRLAGDNKESSEKTLPVIERQVQLMVRLVDDLLEVSRITRNKLQLRKERIELAPVVRQAVETSRPLIEEARHELAVSLPDQPIYVDGDAARLAQVFANLLNNSAKYTEPGGRIWLTVETASEGRRPPGEVVIRIKDTGIGIAADHLPHVFEMFTQADHSLERSQGGLGIGLTLVKRLVEMHDGTVEAFSEGPNQGSEFVVRLPQSTRQTEPAGCVREGAETIADASNSIAKRPCKLLIVDDNADAADSMRTILHILGHEVRIAHDGLEAVGAAESFLPDVMLLDIGLPKLNGYEVAERIRRQSWGKNMKLVALTGWGQEEDKRRSMQAGFDRHLIKPVDPAKLSELLRQLCPEFA